MCQQQTDCVYSCSLLWRRNFQTTIQKVGLGCACIYALIVTVTLHSYTAISLYGVLMECYFLECYQVRILIDAVVIA